jgi:hypothetical protein
VVDLLEKSIGKIGIEPKKNWENGEFPWKMWD